jgi:hypothetical protein
MTTPHDTGAPWAIPYPDQLDDANDPAQSQLRAEKIHADLNTINDKVTATSDWNVPNGNLVLGDSANTAARIFRFRRLVGAVAYETIVYLDSATYPLIIQCTAAGVTKNQITLGGDGSILVWSGSTVIARPVPFAMAAGVVSVTRTASNVGWAQMNWPVNRFTQPPILTCSAIDSTALNNAGSWGGTNVTYGLASLNANSNVAGTATIQVYWSAVQMTPASAPGLMTSSLLLADDGTVEILSTCRTADCENENLAITSVVPDVAGGSVWCGACGQAIDDVVEGASI